MSNGDLECTLPHSPTATRSAPSMPVAGWCTLAQFSAENTDSSTIVVFTPDNVKGRPRVHTSTLADGNPVCTKYASRWMVHPSATLGGEHRFVDHSSFHTG